jgi:hypothetical protein
VPYQVKGEPRIKMLQPEGWSVFRTISGDSVQISKGPIEIHVTTLKLRSEPPLTVDEYRASVQDWAADGEIRQLQVPGTVSAFEMKYTSTWEVPVTILGLDLNGTTFNQTLSVSCPTELFAEWEPVFRKILASFEHDNLDATPLPSRP